MLNRRHWFGTIITCAVIAALSSFDSAAHAQMVGDRAALKKVATAYRENLDQLKTWTGTAQSVRESIDKSDANKSYRTELTSTYLVDLPADEFWYHVKTDKVAHADGRPRSDEFLFADAAMWRHKLFVWHSFHPVTSTKHIAHLAGKPESGSGWSTNQFRPRFFFTYEGEDHDDFLNELDRTFDDTQRKGTVSVADGDNVVVTMQHGENVTETRTYSLANGGNMTSITTDLEEAKFKYYSLIAWEWEKLGEVYVPKKVTREQQESSEGQPDTELSIEISFTEQKVNEPLPEDAFSLKHLELRPGDAIRDGRDKKTFILKDEDFSRGIEFAK